MVRPVICCMGTRGDVQPFIALALGLAAAEDDPLLLVPPEYLSWVEEYGIPVEAYSHSIQVSTLTTEDGQAMQHGNSSERLEATVQLFQPLFSSWLQETVQWVQQHNADVLLLTQWLWLAGSAVIPTLCNMPQLKVYFVHLVPGDRTSEFAQPTAVSARGFTLTPLNRLSWWFTDRMGHNLYHKLAVEVTDTCHDSLCPLSTVFERKQAVTQTAAQQAVHPVPTVPPDFGQDACTNLYAYSRHLLPKPRDWPARCKVVGPMLLPGEGYTGPLPDGMDTVLDDAFNSASPVVFVGFGSMLEVYCHPDAAQQVGCMLFEAMRLVRQRVPVKFLVQTGEGTGAVGPSPFAKETVQAVWDQGLGVVVNHAFPHAVVFPRCHLVLCHGGVGTLHTALAAGVPVGVMPCQAPSDQGFWRDVVHSKATAMSLRDAILDGLRGHERYSQAAKQLAPKLRDEHGVAQVVAFLTARL